MASYPAPDDRRSNVFNETDYLTTPSELASVGEEGKYVKVSGDFMSGPLSAPSLSTNDLTFPTGVQTQAFTNMLYELVNTMKTKTQNLASPVLGVTEINGLTATNNLRLYNGTLTFADASVQTVAFTDADRVNLDTCVTKTTSVSYDTALLKTTVANSLHATTFTTGSFNSSHLSGTTSNLQQQLVDSNLRTRFINSSQIEGQNRTLVGGTLDTNFINLYSTETESATLTFPDDTQQRTAFQDSDKTQIATMQQKVNRIPYITPQGRFSAVSVGSGHVSDNDYECLTGCTYNLQSILNLLTMPTLSQKWNFDASLITEQSGNTFPTNTPYDNNKTIVMQNLSAFNLDWQYKGLLNNQFEFVRGVYLITVKMRIYNLKWYRKFLFIFFNFPENAASIKQGIELNSSSTNELEKFVSASHILRVTNTATSFQLRFEYWFATEITGSGLLDIELIITEL
jgi:hypothetical protein